MLFPRRHDRQRQPTGKTALHLLALPRLAPLPPELRRPFRLRLALVRRDLAPDPLPVPLVDRGFPGGIRSTQRGPFLPVALLRGRANVAQDRGGAWRALCGPLDGLLRIPEGGSPGSRLLPPSGLLRPLCAAAVGIDAALFRVRVFAPLLGLSLKLRRPLRADDLTALLLVVIGPTVQRPHPVRVDLRHAPVLRRNPVHDHMHMRVRRVPVRHDHRLVPLKPQNPQAVIRRPRHLAPVQLPGLVRVPRQRIGHNRILRLAPGGLDAGFRLQLVRPLGGGDHHPGRHLGPVGGKVARLGPCHPLGRGRMLSHLRPALVVGVIGHCSLEAAALCGELEVHSSIPASRSMAPRTSASTSPRSCGTP